MPRWRGLVARWPHASLRASEDAVGLPAGQMGNSEVGHLNLGAGRPVLQDLPRIDAAIADGSFFTRPALLAACERASRPRAASTPSASSGRAASTPTTVTSWPSWSWRHAWASRPSESTRCSTAATRHPAPPWGSCGTSRPGSPPSHPDVRVASVGGRYYAMDRDRRWERIERRLRRHRPRRGAPRGARRRPRSRRPTRVARPTSSSRPTVIDGTERCAARRRPDRPRQLPGRPGASAHPRARRRRVRPVRPRRPRRRRRSPSDLLVATMTEYESGLPGPGRCSGPRRRDRSPRPSPRSAGRSSTSRRPRSTPT